MTIPQQMNIIFRHHGIDYTINLVKSKDSDHCVAINGVSYAVLGEEGKLDAACKILGSVSLNLITSEEDLKGRLFQRGDISFPQAQKADEVGIEILQSRESSSQRTKALEKAYKTLAKDLKEYVKGNLKEGALLVQVVGIKGAETPLVFGTRSVNDVVPVDVDEHTIGRTGSGAKLWAGLLTNVLTTKYGKYKYIQMDDELDKFAPEEALRKFGRIGSNGQNIVDAELAKEISIKGLIGMMAGLEYEQPKPRNPPETTLDQFMRGNEINDGSIHILYHPKDKINFYTNNICFIAYPIEKAYKKVLAAELIDQNQLDENQKLRDLIPDLEVFRNQLQEKIKKTEAAIESMRSLGAFDDVSAPDKNQKTEAEIESMGQLGTTFDNAMAPYKNRLAVLKADLQRFSVPDSVQDLTLKDLMACESAYTGSPERVYIYDLIDLFLMPSNNHQVDYAEIMKRELFSPIGMKNSGFHDVPGIHMDVTYENETTEQDVSFTPPKDHPMKFGAGFGRTSLSDASKLAAGLSDSRGLVSEDGKTTLLTPEELNDFFKPHGHYEGWGLGGAELSCDGKVIDKGGSLSQDQYSFWVDRESGVGMIAMCNCGRRPDKILNDFKEKVEDINYPNSKAKRLVKEKEGTPLGIPIDYYFALPLNLKDVQKLFDGTRGRIALLFDYDTAKKGIIHWSGTPLEVEKKDGAFHVTTPGRFKDLVIKKMKGEVSKKEYLAVGDTSFIEINEDSLPTQSDIERAQKEFPQFKGGYKNKKHEEWGTLEFDVLEDNQGNILLGAREVGPKDVEQKNFVPQGIVEVEPNSILFNGHDRQPPDKIFKFVRESESAPWRLQVLDYASRQFIEERPKS